MLNQIIHVLQRMSIYKSPISEKRIINEVLQNCKRERKGLSKQEIAEKGYNIFENRNVKIRDVLERAIAQGYIIDTPFEPNNRMFQLSDIGRSFLFMFYTKNYSDEFQEFEAKVNSIMLSHHELPLNQKHIAISFWEEDTPENFCEYYLKQTVYKNKIKEYHHYLLSRMGHTIQNEDIVFHFNPKLFLPKDKIGSNVRLEIKGISAPNELNVTQPYPNKRYYVAGYNSDGIKISTGYYPIIAKRELFPKELEILLIWKVDNFKINHHLLITFEFGNHHGNFFSTEQYISRSHNINEIGVQTYIEKDEKLWGNRKPLFSSKNVFRELTIEEHVTLTNFPIQLHSAFHADKNFRKWLECKL